MTPAEKAAITVKADAYSLSASTYLRELALRSTRLPTRRSEKINHRENEPICNVFVPYDKILAGSVRARVHALNECSAAPTVRSPRPSG